MGVRPQGNPHDFASGDHVRYRPGNTYGYEFAVERDGRIPAVVHSLTPTRVRIRFRNGDFGQVLRAVDAASLTRATGAV